MKKYLALLLLIFLIGCSSIPKEELCNNVEGTWLEEYQECTSISKDACDELKGEYNECASPCRHNPKAELCIMSCEQVCNLN